MEKTFIKVLLIMAVLFAFMVPGFLLKKRKMLGEGATLTLSNLLLYVCQPALSVSAFCVFDRAAWESIKSLNKLTLLENFGVVAAVTVLSIGLMFAVCKLIFLRTKDKKSANVYSFIAIFSNCGFLGVPFVQMLTNNDPLAVMYIMVFNLIFIVLCWTLGVVLITGNLRDIRFKKIICNPSIIASAAAVILFFVPEINFFMFEGLEELQILPKYLATMTAPLSMVIVGIRVAEMKPAQLFCKRGVYVSGALRYIVAPLLTFALVLPFYFLILNGRGGIGGSDEYIFLAPVIAMTMSPASSVVAMAESFGGDRETAAAAFVTNTLIGVLAIPLMMTAQTALWALL